MATTTLLKSWEMLPNTGLKHVLITLADTTDAGDDVDITLTDYGISATGLLSVDSWVHTASGSIITTEANTTTLSGGVLTVGIVAGTDNDFRVIEIVGRPDAGVWV